MLWMSIFLSSLQLDLASVCSTSLGSKQGCKGLKIVQNIGLSWFEKCVFLTVSQMFMLQQFSIVISHCSAVMGRLVRGVSPAELVLGCLRTTNVFLMRGLFGL